MLKRHSIAPTALIFVVLALLLVSQTGPPLVIRGVIAYIDAATQIHKYPVGHPRRVEIEKLKELILCTGH